MTTEGDLDSDGNPFTYENSDIHKATNGREAVDKVIKAHEGGKFSYGLIFMDCSMPIMDGYEASDEIKNYLLKRKMYQPMIVAVTGHAE